MVGKMPDREKIIYDIERCICHVPDACRDCSHYKHGEYLDCMEELLKDALSLLKEQKPEEEKIPEYPCKNCCSPSERAACCGCEKERQWQTKYGKQKGQ